MLLPSAIAAGAVGTFAGLSAAAWTAIGFASSVGLGLHERNKAKKAANKAWSESLQDRLINFKSTVATRKYLVGTLSLGGTIMYVDPIGPQGEALDSVIAYAANNCSLTAWYLGDERVPGATFPGTKYGSRETLWTRGAETMTAGPKTITLPHTPVAQPTVSMTIIESEGAGFVNIPVTHWSGATLQFTVPAGGGHIEWSYNYLSASKLRGQYKAGTSDQSSTPWDGYDSPNWTANHRLRSVAHARTLNIWDDNVYADGMPEVTLELNGNGLAEHPLYDPRTGTTAPYTRNPAILAAWFMTLPKRLGGCGVPSAYMDWPSVSAAANVCDETITVRKIDGSGYESIPRYRCDTLIDTARPPRENLDVILSSMAGDYARSGGVFRIMAGSFRAATRTLTDADIISISGSTYNSN
ncbi:MAG TPA: hypothetical protein PK177_17240, partial [Burkholderiaceae bacterium]|nr:hypothetical protein [Burkholderiaceae bacterium]